MKNLQQKIEDTKPHLPEQPRPLMREMPAADLFPVDALGTVLGDAAKAIQDKIQSPIAICGQSVLAAAALAVQGHADIMLPMGQVKPVCNFFMSIAESGERKSASDSEALWPVRKHEAKLRENHDDEYLAYENEKTAWDVERKKIEKDTKNKDQKALKQALDKLGKPPLPPLEPMMICPEPTFEGLCKLLATGRPSIGIFSAEGGQFIGGHGMTDENKLRTATGLSSVWDGEPIRRVRAGDGVVMLPGRRCAAHLMVQPDVAAIMLNDPLLIGQGLLSRFLVTAPESTTGTRLWHEASPESDRYIKKYGAKILSILEMPLPLAQGKRNELIPRPLPLSPEARKLWIRYADHIELKIGSGGALEPIRGFANKLPEHATRLAAVLNFLDNPSIGEIDSASMEAGIMLSDHYAAEALRLFGMSRINPDLRLAQKLLVWLQNKWPEEWVSLPDIYQRGLNAIGDKNTAARIVAILENHGWMVKLKGPHVVAGERRRDVWQIAGKG